MSKILKKISAVFLLILMLFSVSFNVLDYGYKVYAANVTDNGNGTYTITSNKFKLIVDSDLYSYMTEEQWKSWLSKYDNYYSSLAAFTGVNPLAETGNSYITIDATSDTVITPEGKSVYAYYHTYNNGWDCTISIRKSKLGSDIANIKGDINNRDSYTLIHELGHAFQYAYELNGAYPEGWCYQVEVMTMLEAEYIQSQYNIGTLYYSGLTSFTDCKTAYNNQMNGHDTLYNEYYWLAGKLLTIRDSYTNLSSFQSTIYSMTSTTSTSYSNRFNTFIDVFSEKSGIDIWQYFSDSDKSRVASIINDGGTIGTLKQTETPTADVTVNLETNITKSSSTYTIGKDTEILVTGTVTTNTEIDKVMVNGNSVATITKQPSGYTYSATIKPTEATAGEKTISVAVIKDNNTLTTKSVTINLVKEDTTVNVTVNLKTNITQSSSTYTIGKDTEILVTGEVTTNTEIDEVRVNGNSVATITKQPSGYTYSATIKPTEATAGEKQISVAVIKDNNVLTTKSATIKLVKEEVKATITNVKLVGNNSNTDNKLDLSKDEKITITVELESTEDIDSIKITLGKKKYSISKGTKSDNKITYSGSIDLTEEIKTGLKENSTVIVTAVKDEKELDKFTQNLTFISGEISIGAIQFKQDESTLKSEIYDATGSKNVKVSIDVDGLENEKDLTFATVTLEGFVPTGEKPTVNISSSEKIATITMNIKQRDGVTLENGKIDGEVILIINGEQLRGNFAIEIINAEEKESEYPYYYKLGVQEEKQVPEDKQITVHVREAIFITVKETDTSDTKLTVSNLELDGTYENGQTIYKGFHFTGTGKATAKLEEEIVAEFTIIEEEKKETLYVFNVSGSGIGKQPGEGTIVKVDRDSVNNNGTYGGTSNWLIKSEGGKNYYCYHHGKDLRFESGTYFYRYEESEQVEVSKKDQLILAYIKNITNEEASKIAGITLSGEDWKEHLIQYYIWNNIAEGNSSANYGQLQNFINKITTFTNEKNEYINVKEGTITLGGKTYTIKNFSASKYIVNAKYYASSGDPKWANYTDSDMQPLFTFEVELEEGDTPGIYLEKIDGKTEKNLVAEFTVYKYDETKNELKLFPDAVVTKKDGKIKIEGISLTEEAKYIIKETKAPTEPTKYNITTQYIVLEIDPSVKEPVKITVYEATNKETTGVAKPQPSSDTQVKNSDIWELDSSETTEKGEPIYTVIVKNYPDTPKLKKVDETTNAALSGAEFTVYKEQNGKLVSTGVKTNATDEKEYADLSEIFNNKDCYTETNGTKQIILRETTAPKGYNKTDAVYVITMDKEGKLTGKYYETKNNWENNKDAKELTIEDETGAVIIKNKTGTPTLELEKVDSEGNAIKGKGGKFQITLKANGETIYNEELTLNAEGKIVIELTEEQISKIVSNQTENKRIPIEVTVKEIEAPEGYAKGEQDTFTFTTYYYEDTGWEAPTNVQGNGIFTATKQGALISMILKNETDTPRIEITKTDDKGNAIEGTVVFTVYSDESCTNSVGTITVTNGETTTLQLPEIGANSTATYYIKETTTPIGYKELDSIIKLEITTDENGKVKEATADGKPVSLNGNIIILTIVNESVEVDKLQLKILKTDYDTDKAISGVEFSISGDIEGGSYSGSTDASGTIGPLDYVELEKGHEYTVTIKEKSAPSDYIKIEEDIVVTVYIDENGKLQEPRLISNTQGVSVNVEQIEGIYTIIVKVENVKNKTDAEFPLLMYIKGTVWLEELSGKNSEADGYYGSGNERGLDGILVTLYESDGTTPAVIANKDVVDEAVKKATEAGYTIPSEITDHISNLEDAKNEIITSGGGKFAFYGLDPAKTYVVKFTYNGMRYEEIKVSTTTKISGYNIKKENASKAIENETERKELTTTFSEIGTYPYNYKSKSLNGWNIAFNQDEVEKEVPTAKYGEYIKELQTKTSELTPIEAFIKDTEITATISGLGDILSDSEEDIKIKNDAIDDVDAYFVYPVVSEKLIGSYTTLEEAQSEYEALKADGLAVGYKITKSQQYEHYHHDWESCGKCGVSRDQEFTAFPVLTVEAWWNFKEKELYDSDFPRNIHVEGSHCSMIVSTGNPKQPTISVGVGSRGLIDIYEPIGEPTFNLMIYYVVEGYHSISESGIRFAIFNRNLEPYYGVEYKRQSKLYGLKGNVIFASPFGWYDKERDIQTIYNELAENIDKYNKVKKDGNNDLSHANLGVLYRPTMDLGLYNDVVQAYVNINNKEETYVYDKRAANGGSFEFGVNEYEINSPPNNVETSYEKYYEALSEYPKYGEIDTSRKKEKEIEYTDLRQKEDIFPNTSPGETENGTAEAGGYNTYPISIKLTYKIRVVNQAGVRALATEIVDYYDNEFNFLGAYLNREKTQPITASDTSIYDNRGAKGSAPDGYNTKYIKLDTWLENNEYIDIYIELEMKDPRTSLSGKLEPGGEGFKTLNYAEINGYKTDIGVIDIDSMPGNLIDDGKGRFANGEYEDDESKSPTYIIRNPGDKVRTIAGTLFEDKTDEKTNIGANRDGDGIFNGDTPVVGGIVQLIEVNDSGSPIGTGIRAQTLTDANGNYTFTKITPGNYEVQFIYGGDGQGEHNQTVLINTNGGSNAKSYNGQDYENTIKLQNNTGNNHWYTVNPDTRNSDATDNQTRRNAVIAYSTTLTNHIAEVFNSWKDSKPNMDLVRELNVNTFMYANTELMSIEVENPEKYQQLLVETDENGNYEYEYAVINIDFGIVERERAELQIIKTVKEISIVDSSGKEITGGKAGEDIKYVKWIEGTGGFVDMEIDSELLSGATLHITYEIKVENTSEAGNNISQIKVVDYVSNNLNFDKTKNSEWTPVTVEQIRPYINNTSLDSTDTSNKIDLSTYQTILMTEFSGAGTKTLTLEKNLSSEEDSNFNYENQVEIVSSYNPNGRGDYSSIYGNLDPTTYTSRQGNLKWENDYIETANQNRFPQQPTDETVVASGVKIDKPNAIRIAEKDSGNAEEVIITPPTGAKGIVFETYHYVLALIGLLSIAGTAILIKKYISLAKE